MPGDNRTEAAPASNRDIAKSLEFYERIASAQRAGKSVAIPSSERPTGVFARFKSVRETAVPADYALMMAQEQLRSSVIRKHGTWGWRQLLSRVPELRALPELHRDALRASSRPLSDLADAAELRAKISTAYHDVDEIARAAKHLINSRNPEVDQVLVPSDRLAHGSGAGQPDRHPADYWAIASAQADSPINQVMNKSVLRNDADDRQKVMRAFDKRMSTLVAPTVQHAAKGYTAVEVSAISRQVLAEFLLEAGSHGRFDYHEAGLELLADAVTADFAPPGTGWALASRFAGDETPLTAKDRETIPMILSARVREHVRSQGKLPSRELVFNLAVALACERLHKPAPPYFGSDPNAVDLGQYGEGLGRADFPTAELQQAVESLAQESGVNVGSLDLSTALPKAMLRIWLDQGRMLAGYGTRLHDEFVAINAEVPVAGAPEPGSVESFDLRQLQQTKKIQMLMPGSKLFEYLRACNPDPALGPEALQSYRAAMLDHISMGTTDFGTHAQTAYLEAQNQERAREQPKDPATLAALARSLSPKMAKAMAESGRVDTFLEATPDWQKSMLESMSEPGDDAVADGYHPTFIQDIIRTHWVFERNGQVDHEKPGPQLAAKLQKYESFFDGNTQAARTLGNVLHQRNIGSFMERRARSAYSAGRPELEATHFASLEDVGVFPLRDAHDAQVNLRRLEPGMVEVEYTALRAANTLTLNGTHDLPINRSIDLQGALSEQTAAMRQTIKAVFNLADLANGVLEPRISQAPQIELHIAPDWGLIATMRREGTLTLPNN
ncbi:MAG: hypothetical protein ACK47V_02735 [Betaproteobacteria bacterium]